MKAIGGYFELELATGNPYHNKAVALNTGRNALEYILMANRFSKLYIPYYTCHVLLQPFERLEITYEYYSIDEYFEPLFDYSVMKQGEAFLYTNYYGLKDAFIDELSKKISNLIVDNAQAFFSKPKARYHAFYSARKFFGVPDGGYAYTHRHPAESFPTDQSYKRFAHLLLRLEDGPESGYPAFVANDKLLDNNPVRSMSILTRTLLASIPYEKHAFIRRNNYQYMYHALREYNGIDLPLPNDTVPMVYPFLEKSAEVLRSKLIANRIYVAQYWPEVLDLCAPVTIEYNYAANLIPLPIDQRLSTSDLNTIINTITNAH